MVDERARWLTHYSSNHQILLVGDGDFSFSLGLARSFRSGINIVASSLDSYDNVIKKYKEAKSNLMILHDLGADVLHGIDATKMRLYADLSNRRFDRIIFNFPHAGFDGRESQPRLIEKHKSLVRGFFANAKDMLRMDGEVHVNHKTTPPFSLWNLEILASSNSLVLIRRVEFKIEDYPSYRQKRGDGKRCDKPFPLGEASTFMFRLSPRLYKEQGTALLWSDSIPRNPDQVQVWNSTNPFGVVAYENGVGARPGVYDHRVIREPDFDLERDLRHHVWRPELDPREFRSTARDSRISVHRRSSHCINTRHRLGHVDCPDPFRGNYTDQRGPGLVYDAGRYDEREYSRHPLRFARESRSHEQPFSTDNFLYDY